MIKPIPSGYLRQDFFLFSLRIAESDMAFDDAARFRFIAKFRLHVCFHDDHVSLMWQKKVQHWEASPPYFPVASGPTLEDATDAAIERWEKKHGKCYNPSERS